MMDTQSSGNNRMPYRRRSPGLPAASTFARVAAALDAFCAGEQVPPSVAWRLRVALDELVANIVSHGAPGGRLPAVDLALRRDGDHVEIVLADDGPAFDPVASPDPDLTLPLEARQPGGLGIALVKALVDEVRYERREGNVVTLRVRIDPADSATDPGTA
jgi:serine/threonine-protein kinase RsbW